MGFYQFRRKQYINSTLQEVWDFISSPHNLQRITPASMDFNVLTPNLPAKMYAGMLIQYSVRPMWSIPLNWLTEITHVEPMHYFIDEQRIGPYALWHHQHILEITENGVLMKDIVSYSPPFGILGRLANKLVIENKLKHIFDYRSKVIHQIFPPK